VAGGNGEQRMRQTAEAGRAVPRLGAWVEPGVGVCWRVWAPSHREVEVVLYGPRGQASGTVPLSEEQPGLFSATLRGGEPGLRYKLRVDGEGPFPDPWSRSQPEGVHAASEVVGADFGWTDGGWKGPDPQRLVLYELHVGTATAEGTFEALLPRLRWLRELGVNALELLPVASFPGERNWGYDGVSLFAPAAVYGGPRGLRRLVDAAHAEGLAVLMDVVYNHFGPDGCYLAPFSPHYFNDRTTPWGQALNYDGEGSAVVREMMLSNAEMWVADYHMDGLRLDATHAIHDQSQPHLLREIGERARAAAPGRQVVVIAEDGRNESRLYRPTSEGGYGLDGVWADDFHYEVRRAFAGDQEGLFRDYRGTAEELALTLERGWLYEGQRSVYFKRARGTPAEPVQPWQFMHYLQNHDQVGNRPRGNRLGEDVSAAAYRAMSVLLLCSPYTPMLFMGQEWNARTPFFFFTDHHPGLGELVRDGRLHEFSAYSGFTPEQVPDPQAVETFLRSKLDWAEAERPGHAEVLALYRELLRLRATEPALRECGRGSYEVWPAGEQGLVMERRAPSGERLYVVVNIRGTLEQRLPEGMRAEVVLWSEEPRFGGTAATPPLKNGVGRLEGPSAAVVRATG
jgi:maltooligosyltrehalose trehalohydrolase